MMIYKKGSSGADVRKIKDRLYELGYLKPKPTHDRFANDTENAVIAFQKDKKLTPDGIVGPLTWAALFSAAPPAPAALDPRIKQLLALIKPCVGSLYIIGGQGHEATVAYLDSRKRAQPTYFTGGKYEYLKKRIEDAKAKGEKLYAWDCSGLFWDAANKMKLYGKNLDTTADVLYRTYCTPIKKSDLRPGDICFRSSSTGKKVHMAVMGEGCIYEAMGAMYGVVTATGADDRRALNGATGKLDKALPWDSFGRLKVWG